MWLYFPPRISSNAFRSRSKEMLNAVISHVQPLDMGQAVFREITGGTTNTIKVLLEL